MASTIQKKRKNSVAAKSNKETKRPLDKCIEKDNNVDESDHEKKANIMISSVQADIVQYVERRGTDVILGRRCDPCTFRGTFKKEFNHHGSQVYWPSGDSNIGYMTYQVALLKALYNKQNIWMLISKISGGEDDIMEVLNVCLVNGDLEYLRLVHTANHLFIFELFERLGSNTYDYYHHFSQWNSSLWTHLDTGVLAYKNGYLPDTVLPPNYLRISGYVVAESIHYIQLATKFISQLVSIVWDYC
jgi:hypothetical protein